MLERVSVVLKHSLRGEYHKSIMNRSWVTKYSDFVFFIAFSADDILRMVWARPGIIKL